LDAEAALAEPVRNLPRYAPPPSVWNRIETALSRQARPGRTIGRQRWWAAAAATAGLLMTAWWHLRPADADIAVHISQEPIDTAVQTVIQEPEDAGFDLVTTLCASRLPVCDDPGFQALRSELDDLTAAKHQLRSALGQYGDDPELAAQLTKIERERSMVLRQLIQMI